MENIEYIFFACWVLYCLVVWTAQSILVRRIRNYHKEIWVELGEPMEVHKFFLACITPSVNNPFGGSPSLMIKTYRSTWRLLKYYFNGNPKLDTDERIRPLKVINRNLFLGVVLVFSVIFIAGITTFLFLVYK